jgi:eukaryotic-like serine/threonine-protein kinase
MSAVRVEIAQQSGRRERAGLFEAGRALWEAFYGNAATGRQSASKAVRQQPFQFFPSTRLKNDALI